VRTVLVSLLGLTSCVSVWDLAPQTPASSWRPLEGSKLVSSSFCTQLIPETFGENKAMNLAELIDIALQNNPMTKESWAKARAAAAEYGQSLAAYYPDITFNGIYDRTRASFIINGPLIPYYLTTAGPEVDLSYTLFDFGKRSSAADAARQSLYYADWNHNYEIQAVVDFVMTDYYSYIFEIAQERADLANLENARASLDAANQKFSLGLVALGDVAQARTQYLQAKINVTTQKQSVENAFARLAATIGLPANLPFEVEPLPEEVKTQSLVENLDELIAKAQNQRQDFLALQANLKSKEALLKNAKAEALPSLNLTADLGKYWFSRGQHEDYHWNAELALSFPIFDGFYYLNGIKGAKANVQLAQAMVLKKELSIIQEVTTTKMGVETAAANLADTEEYLKAAELQFQIALSSYKAGTTTILEVISAQSSLADAREKKAGAIRAWFQSLASLAFTTGALCATPSL
jgi:outer membrane protein TolC